MKIFVNFLTTFRFLYTLIVLPFLQSRISNMAFIINLIILFATDTLDGLLARRFGVQTLYGSIMDTVADKTLNIILLIILIAHIELLAVVLFCEIMIALLNTFEFARGKKIKSTMIGKAKTWVLAITIIVGYFCYFETMYFDIMNILTLITVVMQILTLVSYLKLLENKKIDKNENEKDKLNKIKNYKDLKYVLFDTKYYLNSIM